MYSGFIIYILISVLIAAIIFIIIEHFTKTPEWLVIDGKEFCPNCGAQRNGLGNFCIECNKVLKNPNEKNK